jgi:hypothetical protein
MVADTGVIPTFPDSIFLAEMRMVLLDKFHNSVGMEL